MESEEGKFTAGKAQVLAFQIGTEESAVCGLPFRITVTGILFAVLLLLSSVSISGFLEGVKEQETLGEVSKLTVAAEQLSMRGEGSEIVLEIRIPRGVSVGFGTLPGREGNWPENADNYYIITGSKSTFYPAVASFSNREINGPLSLGPGRHNLLLSTKIEQGSGRLFVLISETGAD
ncbi:hypothetical protein [Methanosarcina sp.]|uniref:hypothetical protein n=1 Tax=Methanosarcina sp. TaxID=2213 RepID=UPI002ABBDE4F|nr:hypothetical protein [Methanosarcina sp.]MDY9926343.1 hypothetical protein [Methanosarcina sp.]